jgi:hypothetical protein
MTNQTNQDSIAENLLAQHIAAALKDHPGHAEVRINPTIQAIPPNIAANLLIFLQRVQSTGMEAVAWVEAYQYVQQHAPQQPQGIPFGGLPTKE